MARSYPSISSTSRVIGEVWELARHVISRSWDFGSRRSVVGLSVWMQETEARDGENDGESPPDSFGFAKVGVD